MVCRLAKWLNTRERSTKLDILSAKFTFYTLSLQSLKSRIFTQLSGYEYYHTFILYLFAFFFQVNERNIFGFIPRPRTTRFQIPSRNNTQRNCSEEVIPNSFS